MSTTPQNGLGDMGLEGLGLVIGGMILVPGVIALVAMKSAGKKTLPAIGVGAGVSVAVFGALIIKSRIDSAKANTFLAEHDARIAVCEEWRKANKIPAGQSFTYDGVTGNSCWAVTRIDPDTGKRGPPR